MGFEFLDEGYDQFPVLLPIFAIFYNNIAITDEPCFTLQGFEDIVRDETHFALLGDSV
jgi:hypothetical protein